MLSCNFIFTYSAVKDTNCSGRKTTERPQEHRHTILSFLNRQEESQIKLSKKESIKIPKVLSDDRKTT